MGRGRSDIAASSRNGCFPPHGRPRMALRKCRRVSCSRDRSVVRFGTRQRSVSQGRAKLRWKVRPLYRVLIFGNTLHNMSRRFTVPVLWDKKNKTIVNNESSEIIRMFNTEFNDLVPTDKAKIDIYPKELREEIDSVNDWVYSTINSWSLSVFSLASRVLTGCLSRWSLQSRFREQHRSIRGRRLPTVRGPGQGRKDARGQGIPYQQSTDRS